MVEIFKAFFFACLGRSIYSNALTVQAHGQYMQIDATKCLIINYHGLMH